MDYVKMIMSLMGNFPAIVLDLKEIYVPAGDKPVTKKLKFEGGKSDIDVQVTILNRSKFEKKYKAIIFITDL